MEFITATPIDDYARGRWARHVCRNLLGQILLRMAETDMEPNDISRRLEWEPSDIESYLRRLFEGDASLSIKSIAEICFALNCTPEVALRKRAAVLHDDTEPTP